MALTKAHNRMIADASTSVKDFGATGDGVVANEGAFIQAAIDAVSSAGGGVVFVPKGTYNLTQTITLKPDVALVGEGSGVTIFDMGTTGLTLLKTPAVSSTTLTQTNDLSAGETSNTITNTCAAGDFIRYQSNDLFTDRWAGRVVRAYYYEAELFEVKSATSSAVTFTEGAVVNCPVATTQNVDFFTPNSNFTVKGLTLRKSTSVINYSNGLNISQCKHVWIDDIVTENFDNSGILVEKSMHVNIGTTRHIGGSSSLSLNYGVNYSNGTKHCVQQSINGSGHRHVFASGGSGYAIPMYVTLLSAHDVSAVSHSIDCHGDTAYFSINNVHSENGLSLSGLGHKATNCTVTSLTSECLPYEGGQGITYRDMTIKGKKGTGISVYTNETLIESTFENVEIIGTDFDLIQLRSPSQKNVFRNLRLICSSVEAATSSANADTFLTVDAQGTGGIARVETIIDGLYLEGFPSPISIAYRDVKVLNAFLQDCGWQNSFTTEDAAIRVTDGDRSLISNVNIYNKNTNLTWTARSIRLDPTSTVDNITIQHVWDGLTPVANVNYYISFVNSNVDNLFLENIRLRSGGGGNSFSAVSGKYRFQTLTTDN
jgi:hypothetical protein